MESEPSAYYVHSRDEPSSQDQMVDRLKSHNLCTSDVVEKCMRLVDRRHFIPVECDFPYADQSVPIGYGAWIAAPSVQAFCLDMLSSQLKQGANILDIGSGTGYLTIVMALMLQSGGQPARESGRVYAVEHIPELAEMSREIRKRCYPDLEKFIEVFARDGRQGLPEHAPYDCIHVGAVSERLPTELLDQLKPGGRLICPVGIGCSQQLLTVDKSLDGSLEERVVREGVEFPPLSSISCQLDTETFD